MSTDEPRRRAVNAVLQLALVSHANVRSPDAEGRGAPDSRPPTGGVDRRCDLEPGFPQKSHESFRRRLAGAHSDAAYEAIETDAIAALDAWRRTPPNDAHMVRFTFSWKRSIANDTERSVAELARLHGISRKTVYAYIDKYRAPFKVAA